MRAERTRRGPRRLAIASYNVHRCLGLDGRRDPGRVAAVIGELEADVVALQEVEAGGDGDQFTYLERATGYEVHVGPTLEGRRGRYGNAVLCRRPVRATRRHDLSVDGREPRGALELDLDLEGAALRLIATHLGLRRAERRRQIRRLLELVDADPDRPVALLGDMNEWLPQGRSLRRLQARLGRVPSLATFPARRPLLALDRIWVRPRSAVRRLRVHRSALARVASDHLPIRAELVLEDGPTVPGARRR